MTDAQRGPIVLPVDRFTVQIVSDLHLECRRDSDVTMPPSWITPAANILCLCGDIGAPASTDYKAFLTWASETYAWVFVIAGNHEFYHKKIPIEAMRTCIVETCAMLPNVTFLDDQVAVVIYDGGTKKMRVFGSTLWSNIPRSAWPVVKMGISDYCRITTSSFLSPKRFPISPEMTTSFHNKAIKALEQELALDGTTPMVVMTHHLPSFQCIAKEFTKGTHALVNCAYASDLDRLFGRPIVLWAHGHSHRCHDDMMGGTRVVSNPLGYPAEDTHTFHPSHHIDVDLLMSCKM
jgi:hypothetical protein